MTFPNPFQDEDELNAALMNTVANAIYDSVVGEVALRNTYRANFAPYELIVDNGNALAVFSDGLSPAGIYWRQDAAQLNDEWHVSAYLTDDDYTLYMWLGTGTDCGIVSVYMNDNLLTTFDQYNPPGRQLKSVAVSNALITTGKNTVKGIVASKNASSSAYKANIYALWLVGSES